MVQKVKLTEDEFSEFSKFFMLEKIAATKTQLWQLRERRMLLFKQMGNKYGFDWTKAKLYSDGIIEIGS